MPPRRRVRKSKASRARGHNASQVGFGRARPSFPANETSRSPNGLRAPVNAEDVPFPGLSSFRSAASWHLQRWKGWWGASPWNRRLIILMLVYGTLFSVLTSLRILALSAFAWDLGIYNQAMYTTVRYGRFFYLSGLPGASTESLFGGHFSPILLPLLVPYALFPSPFALVVIQSWAIALAAAPVYRLSQKLAGSDFIAFVFALVFLLDPATQGVNWFDFHPEAFLLPTLLAALYFLESRRWRWFLFFSFLALATIEVASVLVGIMALSGLASELWAAWRARRTHDRAKVVVLASLSLASVAWTFLAGAVVQAFNPGATYLAYGVGYWDVLGASGVASVPLQIVLHPDRALNALAYDGSLKLWYLIVLFVPTQLLTLKSPRAVLCCLPWLAVSLTSNAPAYYLVGNQYPSYILPFVFYGAILGISAPWPGAAFVRRVLRRASRVTRPVQQPTEYVRVMVGLTVVLLVAVSPLGPWALGSDTTGRAPVIGIHERAVLQLYGIVPPTASVLTQNNLYPLLSDRLNVHLVPVNVAFPPGASFNSTMDQWIATSDFVLLDCQTNLVEASLILSWLSASSGFSIIGAADGALLLERGSHNMTLFDPLLRNYAYNGVTLENGTIVPDANADEGYALLHLNETTSHFWYGPFLILPPGQYIASYRLKVDRPFVGPLITLPVILHPELIHAQTLPFTGGGEQTFFTLQQLSSQVFVNTTDVQGPGFAGISAYASVTTSFEVTTAGVYEFPGLGASGAVQLWFGGLAVTQLAPGVGAPVPVQWSSG